MVEAFRTQEGDDIMLRNVTITNNTASFGGGISNYFTPINFANTIIAGNTATDPRFTEIFTGYAAVTSLGGNLMATRRAIHLPPLSIRQRIFEIQIRC